MGRQVVSRTQRRMEKRQALVLLGLIFAVSLVSFTLGVMVGRSDTRSAETVAVSAPAPRRPIAVEKKVAEPSAVEKVSQVPVESLTFYDTLPKGEGTPLGSGINMPPARTTTASPSATAAPASDPVVSVEAKAAKKPASAPAAPDGAYLVQVASFRSLNDALKLKDRLVGKSYTVFTEKADLQAKGVWYRVYVGPFADSDAAGRIVARLQAEEKLSALVKKR